MRGAHPLRKIRVGARSPTGFSMRPRKSSATRRGRALAVAPVAYHGDRQQYGGKDKDYGAEDAPWKKKVKWRLDDEEDEENQRRGVTSLGWTPPPPPSDTGQHLNFVKPKRAADKPYEPPPKPPAYAYEPPPKPEVNSWEVASQIGRHGVRPSRLDETALRLLKNAGVDLRQADFDEMEARADEYHMEEAARDELLRLAVLRVLDTPLGRRPTLFVEDRGRDPRLVDLGDDLGQHLRDRPVVPDRHGAQDHDHHRPDHEQGDGIGQQVAQALHEAEEPAFLGSLSGERSPGIRPLGRK